MSKVTLSINVWKPSGKWYSGCKVTTESCSIAHTLSPEFWDWIFKLQKEDFAGGENYSGSGVNSFEGFTVTVDCIQQADEDMTFYNYMKTF